MINYWEKYTVVSNEDLSLGGNLRHGDTNSITPKLWTYLVDRFAVRSILDVGAGEGYALRFFHQHGVISHGFDGLRQNVDNAKYPIAEHDLKKGPYHYPCDLSYCVEVVEHIEEKYVDNLMDTLINSPVVVITHALPGQPGHHHVNNQPKEYWIKKFEKLGYFLSIDNQFFKDIAYQENPNSYFAISGLVFLKANR